jgi:serine/threonine protein kinase
MTPETTEERTRERWKQALDLFEQTLPLPPTEREQILDAAGHQDQALRQTVSDLLLAHRDAEAGNFLESPSWVYQPIEANPQALVGRRIGPYLLTQYLARGGMGIVYLAERADKVFRRQAAVKLIGADTGACHYHRFKREVQILADLKHPNLVMLYDAGRLADGRLYLVMEYVEGGTLREWMNRRGAMPAATAVEIIQQAAAGLHMAHEAGVIHRDIKPANIVASETGGKLTVKVLDFGVAARKQHDGSGVSSTQGAIGTLLYMSPEQLQSTKGRDLTPASDVYALGLTAYELLTGRPAIDGQSQAEIITKHLYEMPVAPSQQRPDLHISPGIDRVVMKTLVKDPAQRYQSVLEFASELETALRQPEDLVEIPDRKTTMLSGDSPTEPPQPALTPSLTGEQPTIRKKSNVAIATTAFAVISIAGAYLAWRQLQSSAPVASPSTAESSIASVQKQKSMPDQPEALEFALDIDSGQRSYSGCRFALFRPEVKSPPDRIDQQNALVIFEGISRKYPERAVKPAVAFKEPIRPGEYLVRFSCPGFKSIESRELVKKSATDPSLATLRIKLTPEKKF